MDSVGFISSRNLTYGEGKLKYEIFINGKCIKSSNKVIPIFDFLLDYCNSRLESVSYKSDENDNYKIYLETR